MLIGEYRRAHRVRKNRIRFRPNSTTFFSRCGARVNSKVYELLHKGAWEISAQLNGAGKLFGWREIFGGTAQPIFCLTALRIMSPIFLSFSSNGQFFFLNYIYLDFFVLNFRVAAQQENLLLQRSSQIQTENGCRIKKKTKYHRAAQAVHPKQCHLFNQAE